MIFEEGSWCLPVCRLSVRSYAVQASFHPSVCPSVRLYICLSVCISVCPSLCLYVSLSIILSVCQSVSLSVCQSVSLSVCQSVSLSVCQSVCHYLKIGGLKVRLTKVTKDFVWLLGLFAKEHTRPPKEAQPERLSPNFQGQSKSCTTYPFPDWSRPWEKISKNNLNQINKCYGSLSFFNFHSIGFILQWLTKSPVEYWFIKTNDTCIYIQINE